MRPEANTLPLICEVIDTHYCGLMKSDIANGTGIRITLWCSGCSIQCPGCHNPESWDPQSGELFTSATEERILKELGKPYVKGITFTGGNPLEEDSLMAVSSIIRDIRELRPKKDIWLYTGKVLTKDSFRYNTGGSPVEVWILRHCDYVVDGPFIESLKDVSLAFRGSSNQRIIDVKRTVSSKDLVLKED